MQRHDTPRSTIARDVHADSQESSVFKEVCATYAHLVGHPDLLIEEIARRARTEHGLRESLRELRGKIVENERLCRENEAARSRAELLYGFAEVVVTAERVEQVFDAALDAIGCALATERAAILVFDEEGVMRFKAWRGLSDRYRAAVEGHSPWARDTVAPKPVLVPDVRADELLASYLPLFEREHIASLAFIPLLSRGKLLGKFMVYYPEARDYHPRELQLSSAIANHLGSVIERFAMINKLKETIHYNELFSGILAHDLRNPLGAIMTAAQLMFETESSADDVQKALGHLMRSGQRMSAMIEQLLDFSQARAGGGIQIQACHTNLADLCQQAVAELALAQPKWRIQVQSCGDPLGCWDPVRLLQVLSNLIANAGQHGSAGGSIVVSLDGADRDVVRFEVHNVGTIAPALLPSLFDPFRSTLHRHDHTRGLGLGLFVVKEIVRAHGGTVTVTSDESGTTFRVRLPRFIRVSAG
jgi:signal transduction histidine kinase